jgi:alanine dehydrogenase
VGLDHHVSGAPLWLTEGDVTALVDLAGAVDAVEEGFREQAEGQARTMVKTQTAWEGGSLHAVGAAYPGAGLVGTKTWAHTGGGACPLLLLFGSDDGQLRAVVEAFALGQMRTAAVSGVATRLLAVREASVMAVCGTGEQALPQVAAVAAVRRLRSVRVFGRDPGRRQELVERISSELGLDATGFADPGQAVRGAEVVTLVTRATTPFLAAAAPDRGAHVNAVGAITLDRAEFEPGLLDRCDLVVADSPTQVRMLSREFKERFRQDEDAWERVMPLSRLAADRQTRPAGADLTLMKAMGVGLADLALGARVYRDALERGAGRVLEPPRRAHPRLRVDPPANLVEGGPQP